MFIWIWRCLNCTEISRSKFALEKEEWIQMVSRYVTNGATAFCQ